MSDIQNLRGQLRVSLSEDGSYVFKLDVAIYSFASVNNFLCEIISKIKSKKYNYTNLQDKTSSRLLEILKSTTKELKENNKLQQAHIILYETVTIFESLSDRCNDVFHTCPIAGESGMQILYRRKDAKNKYYEIKEYFLDQFIHDIEEMTDLLYLIRHIYEVGAIK